MNINSFIFENDKSVWYHGTPDVRDLERDGGFTQRNISLDYITDIDQYHKLQVKLKQARENNDETSYHKYLELVPKLKSKYNLRKPIFLTNDIRVAKTYADSRRAYDYQNSVEKLLKVKVNSGKTVKIVATGDRFRFIEVDKVKRGFINAGINEFEFDKVLSSFNYYLSDKTKIKTDMVAAIGEWFKIDCIDVLGVLDSYEGGSIKSTVRMVFDPNDLKILNIMKEDKISGGLVDNKNIIKKLLKEEINLQISDETPDTITIVVEYNDRNAGIIMVTPANVKNTLEIVGIKFKQDYETLHIISEAVKSLWGQFKDINYLILAPKPEGIQFWNKLGFNRISPNYLILKRAQ